MSFVVLYDANVLYPNTLRDLLIRIGQSGLVDAKWTSTIMDEMLRNLAKNRPDIDEAKLDLLRDRMNHAIRDVLVTGFEGLIPELDLPDLGDRHVLAAAIKCGAQVIVTNNIKHFPRAQLAAGESRQNVPMISSSIRLISMSRSSMPVYSRLLTLGSARPRRLTMSSASLSATAS